LTWLAAGETTGAEDRAGVCHRPSAMAQRLNMSDRYIFVLQFKGKE